MDNEVRVRFAPSPTGPLHIGAARTALFNWIFAKKNGGQFILRIEDTDKERSKPEFEKDIKDGLEWLGIKWDETYRQSERTSIYRKHLEKLIEEGWLYHCFCTEEELEVERQGMLSQGIAPKYSGRCRKLNKREVERRIANKEKSVLRFKVPETKITFKDLVRGNITFDTSLIGDIVVAKDLDKPLYNFAVVIDDALSKITHIIRGEDHISNTPRQILMMNALGIDIPQYAHLPIILNPDRSKMSKRFNDTALKEYIDDGYLPDAVINFLAFLGWHPKKDREIMTPDEITEEFSLSRVQKGGATFSIEKLDWLSGQYINRMETDAFKKAAKRFIPTDWKLTPAIINSVKTRIKKLTELKDMIGFYFELPEYRVELLQWNDESLQNAANNLSKGMELIESIPSDKFNREFLEEKVLNEIPEESRGDILWPLRVALSGKKTSPSPFEIMEALGKEESRRRIGVAMEKTGILGL